MSLLPSCGVLTISAHYNQAKQLAERIISASNSDESQSPPRFQEDSTRHLPWTISNKYYTAHVHFSLAQTKEVTTQDAAGVPACIFVFSPAEQTFRDDFGTLTSRLKESDFEVSIAVSLTSDSEPPLTPDEHEALAGYFNEYGFEYVNGNVKNDLTLTQGHDSDEMGVLGIGRIIDALSTILWPSMVQTAGERRIKTPSTAISGLHEETLQSLLNHGERTSENITSFQDDDEVAALERWLEDGADHEKDVCLGGRDFRDGPDSQLSGADLDHPRSGFDDNFSDFLSAPERPQADAEIDLALPSREEVESTSERIFRLAMVENAGDDSHESFDLSGILAALEVMKEEIAGITDEDEKRKAAARVALSLVYGLDDEPRMT